MRHKLNEKSGLSEAQLASNIEQRIWGYRLHIARRGSTAASAPPQNTALA